MTTGGACVYDSAGDLKQENVPLEPRLMNGAIKANGVSFLVFNGTDYEVATEDSVRGLRKYKGTGDIAKILAEVKMNGGYMVHLQSKGKVGTTRYRQTMFIFREDYNIDELIARYNFTLVS